MCGCLRCEIRLGYRGVVVGENGNQGSDMVHESFSPTNVLGFHQGSLHGSEGDPHTSLKLEIELCAKAEYRVDIHSHAMLVFTLRSLFSS
jgi:hypothetical protein